MPKPISEERKITLSQSEIEYTLDRAKRKNTYLCITEGRLVVKTNFTYPIAKVEAFIREKESWIFSKLSQTSTRFKKQLSFNDGDTIYILDKPYTLKLSTASKNNVETFGDEIIVSISKGEVEPLVEKFLSGLAKAEIDESVSRISTLTGLIPQKVTVKKLTKSWGRCNSRGEISISRALIHYPKSSMDYVVLHELCHLKYMNHSKEFWALVGHFMPDYKLRRNALK